MPGYAESYLRGLRGVMQLRRLQDMEAQQASEQEAVLQRLQMQSMNQRRLQDELERKRQADAFTQWMQLQRMNLQNQTAGRLERAAGAKERAAMAGTLKQGYAWDPSGTRQVPVEGGPAWRDLQSKHAADVSTLNTTKELVTGANQQLDYLLDPKNSSGFTSNFGGYNALVTQFLPGETQDYRAKLEALKSSMKAAGAQLLRGAGGAPGSITEREWPILERMIDSLTPLMSEKAARESLGQIRDRFGRMQRNVKQAYKFEWGDSPFYKSELIAEPTESPEDAAKRQRLEELRRQQPRR